MKELVSGSTIASGSGPRETRLAFEIYKTTEFEIMYFRFLAILALTQITIECCCLHLPPFHESFSRTGH